MSKDFEVMVDSYIESRRAFISRCYTDDDSYHWFLSFKVFFGNCCRVTGMEIEDAKDVLIASYTACTDALINVPLVFPELKDMELYKLFRRILNARRSFIIYYDIYH